MKDILAGIGLLLVAMFFYPYDVSPSFWISKWVAVLFVACLSFAWGISRQVHWSVFPALAYTLLSGLWVWGWRDNSYIAFPDIMRMQIRDSAAFSTLSLILLFGSVAMLSVKRLRWLENVIGIFCAITSVVTITQMLRGMETKNLGGLIWNPSMNACGIALMYPFFYGLRHSWFNLRQSRWKDLVSLTVLSLPLYAVFLCKSHMGTGVMAASLLFMIPWRPKYVLAITFIGVSTVVLAYLWGGELLVPTSGRVAIWTLALKWVNAEVGAWTGAGFGTTAILIPWREGVEGYYTPTYRHIFYWLHSDVVQVLFELGRIGAILYLLPLAYWIKNAFQTPRLVAPTFVWILCAMGNYPSRASLHAAVGTIIFVASFKYAKNNLLVREEFNTFQ